MAPAAKYFVARGVPTRLPALAAISLLFEYAINAASHFSAASKASHRKKSNALNGGQTRLRISRREEASMLLLALGGFMIVIENARCHEIDESPTFA